MLRLKQDYQRLWLRPSEVCQFLGLLSPARPADMYRKVQNLTLGLTCKQALIIGAWVRIFFFSRESMGPSSSNVSRWEVFMGSGTDIINAKPPINLFPTHLKSSCERKNACHATLIMKSCFGQYEKGQKLNSQWICITDLEAGHQEVLV